MPAKKKTELLTFEEALEKIEKISEKLERAELTLDESVELYSEGMKLVAFCKEKLENAERKIAVVSDKNTNATHNYQSTEE